jgi:hypothetical protein
MESDGQPRPAHRPRKEHSVTDIDEARAAMADIRATEQRLAQRMVWPFWRHLLAGLAFGALLFGQTLSNTASILISFGVTIIGVLVMNRDRDQNGLFVSGFSGKRARWVSIVLGTLAIAGLFYVRLGMAEPQREQPVFWVLLAAMIAGGTVMSYLWQVVYQRELRGEAR